MCIQLVGRYRIWLQWLRHFLRRFRQFPCSGHCLLQEGRGHRKYRFFIYVHNKPVTGDRRAVCLLHYITGSSLPAYNTVFAFAPISNIVGGISCTILNSRQITVFHIMTGLLEEYSSSRSPRCPENRFHHYNHKVCAEPRNI